VSFFKDHMTRLQAGANQARSLEEVSRWIETNTFIGGRKYSFKNHEYQPFILNAAEPEWVVRKCSQVGITEMSIRMALGLCGMIRGFTIAYTLPTAKFAATVMNTRVNPVIQSSPFLNEMVTDVDNSEVKQLGDSYLYFKGAASSNAPISVPCDMRIHDEVDFSDPVVLSQYHSRLTHSPYKFKGQLSTPTLPKKGIDYEFSHSRQHFNFCKCNHCNHFFIPEYYQHVRVPGFIGDLHNINKGNLHHHNYREAYVECPSCGKRPSLQPENRHWVCQNTLDNFVAFGVQVTPFDAPNIVTPANLIEASTQYKKLADFHNFGLGLPFEDKESVLTEEELKAVIVSSFNMDSGYSYVMGVDLGMTCWITVGAVHFDGSIRVVHTEGVPVHQLRSRYKELRVQFRVRLTVMDSQPYTETVLTLQKEDVNLYGAVYTEKKGTELFHVVQRDQDPEEGQQALRQVNIVRNRAFDSLMDSLRSGMLSKKPDENDDTWVEHLTDMRRMKDWDATAQEMVFRWVKSAEGNDHLHHSMLYCYIASMIMGVSQGSSLGLPMISTFRVKQSA
jgi:hypothetical protein